MANMHLPTRTYHLRHLRTQLQSPSNAAAISSPQHSLITNLAGPQDPQNACPLFITIPPEIRNVIFLLAAAAYDDKSRPYPEDAYYCTPGYTYHRRIDTALLATSRRIYMETHDLPVSQNEHVFWCSGSRGPPLRFCANPAEYFSQFTEEQKAAVVRVHFFTQLYWLEHGSFQKACDVLANVQPKHVKVTVRYTDRWNWEANRPLCIRSHWKEILTVVKSLQSFEVELHTMERDKTQMEAIAQKMIKWQIPQSDSRMMVTNSKPVKLEKYLGQSSYNTRDRYIRYSTAQKRWFEVRPSVSNPLAYVSATIQWTVKTSEN